MCYFCERGFPTEWLENLLQVILLGKHNELKEKCLFPFYPLQAYFWLGGEMLIWSKKGLLLMSQCGYTSVYDPKVFFFLFWFFFICLLKKCLLYCFGFWALWSSGSFGQDLWILWGLSLDNGPRKRMFIRTGGCYVLCPLGKFQSPGFFLAYPMKEGPASPWEI